MLELDGWAPSRFGELHAATARGKTVLSLSLDAAWLEQHASTVLDPSLRPHVGPQYPDRGAPLFGLLADSSPDRWGRMLMRRRAAFEARLQARKPRNLGELDYLVGVHDLQRPGALRLRAPAGQYLSEGDHLAAPPWSTLRELEHAAWSLDADDDVGETPAYDAWLRLLLAPGSSLGGARPKAGVVDDRGALWIAKFPSAMDGRDVGAWEYVVWKLARAAGIDVPAARLERLTRRHRTFLVKRFDRVGKRRVHYASAMTLAGKADGETGSWLDLVQAVTRYGEAPARDLPQLWRRLVFSICVSNMDDHLRNHGFLLAPGRAGWALAPAFDQNPSPEAGAHALSIDGAEHGNDLELALGVAKWFRLTQRSAAEVLREVRAAVASWDKVARDIKISRGEVDEMAAAFNIEGR